MGLGLDHAIAGNDDPGVAPVRIHGVRTAKTAGLRPADETRDEVVAVSEDEIAGSHVLWVTRGR